jgi:hypothetical protein
VALAEVAGFRRNGGRRNRPAPLDLAQNLFPIYRLTDKLRRIGKETVFSRGVFCMPLSLLLAALSFSAPAPDTVVVCPQEFRAALAPWIEHRTAQGHRISVVSNLGTAEDVTQRIRQAAQGGSLKYIVLVGDADSQGASDIAFSTLTVPTHLVEAKVNINWGSEPEIAGDNLYADLDGDEVPDVAVGRLPVDSAAELSVLVAKVIAYEKSAAFGPWRRQVNFVAGMGGFGAVVDSVLESATRKFLTEGIPAAYKTSVTYGSWRSPFCPDPRQFQNTALARFNEGCLFWVYIGHGQRHGLDQVHTPVGQFPILSATDAAKLRAEQAPPIAVFLACYTGAFDAPQDSLAEEMLRTPGGPVAVLAGSRVTMPYGMAVMGTGLMDEVFQERRPTIGDALLHAKRKLVQDTAAAEANDPTLTRREFLDTVAKAISPRADLLAEERKEHLHLFNLLGDPLLRLRVPGEVTLTAAEEISAGQAFVIEGVAPMAGRMIVELICRRDRLTFDPPARTQLPVSNDGLAQLDAVYAKANDHRWTALQLDSQPGPFSTTLHIPVEARGQSHVRVYLEGADSFAMGSRDVYIRRPAVAAE